MRTHHRLVIAALFALLLASCGSSSSASTTTDAADATSSAVGSDEAAAPDPTAAPDAAASADAGDDNEPEPMVAPASDGSFESPVAELFGIPVSDADEMNEQFAQLQLVAERSIAECMREQGFEYTPVDYSSIDGLGASIDFEGREFAEEYGFGVATSIDGQFAEAFENFKDPNQGYIESLSAGELNAYYSALSGGEISIGDFDDDGESSFDAFEPAGCQGDAYETAYGAIGLFDEFGDELDAMDDAIDSDPRIVEASSAWAACMFDRGYGFTSADDARNDVERRYNALAGQESGGGFADSTGDDGDANVIIIGGGAVFSPEVQAQVDELAIEEREIAVATWECEQPVRAIYDSVRIEYELRFVEENGDAVRAASGS